MNFGVSPNPRAIVIIAAPPSTAMPSFGRCSDPKLMQTMRWASSQPQMTPSGAPRLNTLA